MKPAVSVVTCTYNYGQFLGGAVESVLGQTIGDFEMVVVDDGSTDDTPDVMRPYLRDGRVRYLRTGRRGQAAAKNAALRVARAPLVAFLDADDLWLPAKLERQVALFAADPGLGLVYTRRLLIDPQGRLLGAPLPPLPPLRRGHILGDVFRDNFICFSSAMVRRPALDAAGPFDETLSLAVDYEMWLRVLTRERADFVDEALVKYRVGHASISCRAEERLLTALRIMHRFLDERGGRRLLSRRQVRLAWAETYLHLGLVRRQRSRRAAVGCFLRALAFAPGLGAAWRGLLSLPLPERWWQGLRKALGRPDWAFRQPLPDPNVPHAPQVNGRAPAGPARPVPVDGTARRSGPVARVSSPDEPAAEPVPQQ